MDKRNSNLSLPASIIIAGTLIAIAIIWVKKPIASPTPAPTNQQLNNGQANLSNLVPISTSDHIKGDPNAPIKIIEYSDPSCPYCKIFNSTMVQLMDKYGPSGKVAWIYRSFPLDKPGSRPDGGILHPNSGHESQALECAASVGGNVKFWIFEKLLYETTPSVTSETPNGLDQSLLPKMAKDSGIDQTAFTKCLASEKFKDKVEAQYTDGINIGVNGTPYSVIITPAGSKIPLVGARSLSTMKDAIEAILADKTN